MIKPYHISNCLEAFVTDFGNVPVHSVRAECSDSAVESSLADCLDFDDYDYSYNGFGSGSGFDYSGSGFGSTPNQMDCTTHAGLICGGMQIIEPYLDYTACMQP